MVLIHHVPSLIPAVFSKLLWHKERDQNRIYLTFDDGPVPGVTDFVLDELGKRDQKATFFMVGDNVRKHPELAEKIGKSPHGVGNHTYHHLDGFRTPNKQYYKDVMDCSSVLQETVGRDVQLFRPPYGRITVSQQRMLEGDFQLVMWDVLSGDYDPDISPKKCLSKTKKYSRKGSIVLFHDQLKTDQMIRKILPQYLDFIQNQGFETAVL